MARDWTPGTAAAGQRGLSAPPRAAASRPGQADPPGAAAERARHAEHVMGTVVSFDIPAWAAAPGAVPASTVPASTVPASTVPALREAVRWLHWADRTFSTYALDSDVSRLGRGEIELADCAPEVTEVLAACATLRAQTGGYFSAYPGGSLDPSGYVKGWAVERAARILSDAGSACHLVNGGGDVQCAGGRSGAARPPGRPGATGAPWRVGVSSPLRPGTLAFAVAGRDFAVATSGTAERGAHIVDPVRGRPAAGLASVTVVGASLTCADAYATAVFAMGPRRGREWAESAMDGYEALAILPDGATWQTRGFHRYLVSG